MWWISSVNITFTVDEAVVHTLHFSHSFSQQVSFLWYVVCFLYKTHLFSVSIDVRCIINFLYHLKVFFYLIGLRVLRNISALCLQLYNFSAMICCDQKNISFTTPFSHTPTPNLVATSLFFNFLSIRDFVQSIIMWSRGIFWYLMAFLYEYKPISRYIQNHKIE